MTDRTEESEKALVRWFTGWMETNLEANRHKGGWRHRDDLFDRLREEVEELSDALEQGTAADVVAEAADVANFAMFLADVEQYARPCSHARAVKVWGWVSWCPDCGAIKVVDTWKLPKGSSLDPG